jgi:O-antigen/teichoic acid export membrane protein
MFKPSKVTHRERAGDGPSGDDEARVETAEREGTTTVGDATFDRRAARGTVWVGSSAWVQRLTLIAVIGVLAERLDAQEFGILSIGVLCSNILAVIGALGLADALVYQRDRIHEAAGTVLTAASVVGVLIGTALLFAAPVIASFFHAPQATPIIRAYAPMVALNVIKQVPYSILTRDLAFARRFIPELSSIVGGLVSIGLAFSGAGIWSLVIGDGVRTVLSFALCFIVLTRRFGFAWHSDIATGMWRYGRHILATQVFDFGLQNVDYVLVGRLLGPVALGYYSLAFRIAILPFLTFTYVIAGVQIPYFARLASDAKRLGRAFISTFRVSMALICLFGAGLIVLAPCIQVLGTKWAPSVAVARWLGLYVCLRSGAHLIHALLVGSGRPGVDAALRGAWLVLLALLIATLGASGITTVGIVQAVVAGCFLVAYIAAAVRFVGIRGRQLAADLSRLAVVSTIAGSVVLGLRQFGGIWAADTTWVTLLLLGSAFAITYVTGAMLLIPGIGQNLRRLRTSLV